MKDLVKLDPIPALDIERPTLTASMPAWLEAQRSASAENLQMVDGKFQDVMTLPSELMPTPAQRAAIEGHLAHLRNIDAATPQKSKNAGKATFVLVSDMMKVLASQSMDERGAEVTADAYMTALDEVPFWAVNMAITRWYRGQCGKDEHGDSYHYKWRPDPATLRRLSVIEQLRVMSPVRSLEKVLKAIPYVDTTEEQERGLMAMRGLHLAMNAPGGLSARTKHLTFEEAEKAGRDFYDKNPGMKVDEKQKED